VGLPVLGSALWLGINRPVPIVSMRAISGTWSESVAVSSALTRADSAVHPTEHDVVYAAAGVAFAVLKHWAESVGRAGLCASRLWAPAFRTNAV
jgi:hypothetical protein